MSIQASRDARCDGTPFLLEARIVLSALVCRHTQYATILELTLFYHISLRCRKACRWPCCRSFHHCRLSTRLSYPLSFAILRIYSNFGGLWKTSRWQRGRLPTRSVKSKVRSVHPGSFSAQKDQKFHHGNATLKCTCGRLKTPLHIALCRKSRTANVFRRWPKRPPAPPRTPSEAAKYLQTL